jgi:ubiquinone/menaquinone biosynthesis C-methylase UbiE
MSSTLYDDFKSQEGILCTGGKSMQQSSHDRNSTNYSQAQMDNFYQAFAAGSIKPTSVMNYLQHLFIAERCKPGNWVLDVCCGRTLQVPLLKYVVPGLGGYVGVDISQENLQEAPEVMRYGDGCPPSFPCELIHGDVTTDLLQLNRFFDVVIYTSALEHMEKDCGIASLAQVYQVLHHGTFYLSTPNTPGSSPKKLQHRVHVYEWDREELEEELSRIGFTIIECYGLLSPTNPAMVSVALDRRFGPGASAWFDELQKVMPAPFLNPLVAFAAPDAATELLYVCRRHAH